MSDNKEVTGVEVNLDHLGGVSPEARKLVAEIEINEALAEKEYEGVQKKLKPRKKHSLFFNFVVYTFILAVLAMGVYTLVKSTEQKNIQKAIAPYVEDIDSIGRYETQVSIAMKVRALFEIHNTESYIAARDSLPMTNSLKTRLFPTEEYTGLYRSSEKPDVTVSETMYSLTEGKTDKFLLTVIKKNQVTKEVGQSYVIVELSKGKIVDVVSY